MTCDCFSLPNAAELVARLRSTAKVYYEDSAVLYPAADAIEQLLAENAKLKAEREAAVKDLKYSRVCFTCKHISDPDCDGCHVNMDRWEWRGVTDTNVGSKEEEDAADNASYE